MSQYLPTIRGKMQHVLCNVSGAGDNLERTESCWEQVLYNVMILPVNYTQIKPVFIRNKLATSSAILEHSTETDHFLGLAPGNIWSFPLQRFLHRQCFPTSLDTTKYESLPTNCLKLLNPASPSPILLGRV